MKAVKAFGRGVVRARIPILITALVLLIPAVYGMTHTRINYDMLNYLPADMDTVIGQNELMDEFGKGAFSFLVFEDVPAGILAGEGAGAQVVVMTATHHHPIDTSHPLEVTRHEVLRLWQEEIRLAEVAEEDGTEVEHGT